MWQRSALGVPVSRLRHSSYDMRGYHNATMHGNTILLANVQLFLLLRRCREGGSQQSMRPITGYLDNSSLVVSDFLYNDLARPFF
jgi:hypothetical protein